MGEVVGQLLAPAIGVALSPLPIVGMILMLLSPKARVNGPAFAIGWLAGLAIVIGIVLIFVDPSDLDSGDGTPSTLYGVIHLALGLLLWGLALKQWRSRPKAGESPPLPKWMAGIDKVTPIMALGLGALLSGLNPKNLILGIAAGTTIATAAIDSNQQFVAAIVFMAIASITVIGPVVWFLVGGQSAKVRLESLRTWLVQNNHTIMAIVLLLLGASIVGKALPAFFD